MSETKKVELTVTYDPNYDEDKILDLIKILEPQSKIFWDSLSDDSHSQLMGIVHESLCQLLTSIPEWLPISATAGPGGIFIDLYLAYSDIPTDSEIVKSLIYARQHPEFKPEQTEPKFLARHLSKYVDAIIKFLLPWSNWVLEPVIQNEIQ